MEQIGRFVETKKLHFPVVKEIFQSPSQSVFGGSSGKPRLLSGKRPVESVRVFDLEPRQHLVLFEKEGLDVRFPAEGFVPGDQFEVNGREGVFGEGFFKSFPFRSFVDEPSLEAAFSHVGGSDHEQKKGSVSRDQGGIDLPLDGNQLRVIDTELLEILERLPLFDRKGLRVFCGHSVRNLP